MSAPRAFHLLIGGAVSVVATAAAGAWWLRSSDHDVVISIMLGAAAVYGAVAWFVWRHEADLLGAWQSRALVVILVAATLARVLLLAPPPVSTDIYRYIWDGRVQAADINPYRYRPADAPLEFLRDEEIFPRINRAATAVTIYPPLAQGIFLAVTRLSEKVWVMKAAMAGFDLLSIGVLLTLLRRRGLPQTRVLFYAWHPLPLFEFAGSGHIDAAAIALMLLACLLAESRRALLAGALLAGAILVKLFPAVIAPILYRRWDWRFPAALLVAMIALYLPYLGVGAQVLGFLPGYLNQEHLTTGEGFFLLDALARLAPLAGWASAVYLAAGLAVLTGIAIRVVFRRQSAATPMDSALLLLAVFTVLLSPHLAWYFTWVLPFLCFRPSWGVVYLSAAAPLLYQIVWSPDALLLNAVLYVPFLLIVIFEFFIRPRMPALGVTSERNLGPRHAS